MKQKLFAILVVATVLFGCEEQLETQNAKQTNLLTFKNLNEMSDYLIGTGDGQGNFKSFDKIYLEAVDKLAEAVTEEEHSKLLAEYSDVVKLVDETYEPVLTNSRYRKIVNRDRLYIADGYVHKVLDDQFIVFTDKKNINELRQINSIQGLNRDVFKVLQYQNFDGSNSSPDGRTNADCGNNLRKDYFDNQPNCRNDRRVWVRGYTYYLISGYYYTPYVISEAWGELRTGTFCNWKGYQTRLSTRSCSFTSTASLNGTTYSFYQAPSDYNGTTDEYSHTIWNGPVSANAIYWQGGTPPTIQFTQIHLEANSRGTGDNWVVLDCQ